MCMVAAEPLLLYFTFRASLWLFVTRIFRLFVEISFDIVEPKVDTKRHKGAFIIYLEGGL